MGIDLVNDDNKDLLKWILEATGLVICIVMFTTIAYFLLQELKP